MKMRHQQLHMNWVLILLMVYGGATSTLDVKTHLPAAAHCCADPYNFVDTANHRCLNINTGVTTDMTLKCNFSSFRINDGEYLKSWMTDDGRVLLKIMAWKFELRTGSYCMGNTTEDILNLAMCLPSISGATMRGICIVSVVFLLLTILVYGVLPELRDTQGLCIISLCTSLVVFQLIASIASMAGFISLKNCAARAFSVYFFLMASLAWMNAITFQMFRSVRYSGEPAGKLTFLWYSLYGWGLPTVMLVIVLLANYVPEAEGSVGIGISNCWFWETYSRWLYINVPIILLTLGNCVLFAWISFILWKKSDIQHSVRHNTNRYKFLFSLRLFIVMGVTWIFEPISFAHGGNHIIWDIAQVWTFLQGVMIFIVLVLLRKRALMGLVRRNYTFCLTPLLKKCLNRFSDEEDVDFMQHVDAAETTETDVDTKQ